MTVVNSYNQEFGYELLTAVPYAYELHLRGKLTGTISGKWSGPLYYFSPNHEINPKKRDFQHTAKAKVNGMPYTDIHRPDQPEKKFPPYKEKYKNSEYKWVKPTLCICNRANIEWGYEMINYFDTEILDWLFTNLKRKYEIVYIPVQIPDEIQDHIKPAEISDIEVARKHKVRVLSDMVKDNWNDTLLRVFANCERFITMNGGYSILASMFSGQNIIYSKPGKVETKELKMGSFWRWYPNINNVQTLHVPSYEDLKTKVKALYIDKLPTANVIIRTSNRPNGFEVAIESVLDQDYPNINIVAVCDEPRGLNYTRGYPCRVIQTKEVESCKPLKNDTYGVWFPANDYIRQVQSRLSGYIFILDDDDMFVDNSAISKIMAEVKPSFLTIWKCKYMERSLPSDSFGKKPTLFDIGSCCMTYHSSQIKKTGWSPFKRADYRTAAGFNKYIWINEILTGLQAAPGYGNRKDLPRPQYQIPMKKDNVKVKFVTDFKGHKKGDETTLKWIIAANYIYRGKCKEVQLQEKKAEPKLQDKEQKPVYENKAETMTTKTMSVKRKPRKRKTTKK